MDEIFNKDMNTGSGHHKVDGEARKKLDAEDRSMIREEFPECYHPLKSGAVKVMNISKCHHPLKSGAVKVMHISNGCVADEKVNVHDAVSIGRRMAVEFKCGLSDSFRQSACTSVYNYFCHCFIIISHTNLIHR